jgi:hypothetical protein
MKRLKWVGPFVLRAYLSSLLDMTGKLWPPSKPGVYVVTKQLWTGKPTAGNVLYTGASKNLLDRIGNFVRDILGFHGCAEDGSQWVGNHSGAQALWKVCYEDSFPVGQLHIGWAATSSPCHWCTEKELATLLKPTANQRLGRSTCCCPGADG